MDDATKPAASAAHDSHEELGHPFWPTHVLDETMILFVVIGVILTLAIVMPFGLHGEADPIKTPAHIKPEWYFLAVYQFLKYVPKLLGITTVGVFFACMFAWPFVDGKLARRGGNMRSMKGVGWLVMFVITLLTFLGKVSDTTVHVGGLAVSFSSKGFPHFGDTGEHLEVEGHGQ